MRPTVTIAAILFALSPAALAHSTHDHGAPRQPAQRDSTAEMPIPETYAGVLTAMQWNVKAAGDAISAFKIADLHRATTGLQALAEVLPARSDTLNRKGKATVAATAAHIQAQLTTLITAADSGNLADAEAARGSIIADLETLTALIP